ncbi:ribonuclease H-like protein [Pseudovirgaria hyperparasitica]|uniref:Ribonuclease H-like protein n=1 Tax=Pseudovirgaria hyperparasitica TaxID=470096 RepID=A0A6A6WET0_9PEZI|nr:ribonuclease H-like protein [Pseudovirgaria hyperparasitica]KAF2760396.1 ribonuclease H-like protein [Pseudovirgaria hyperparasitica]
MIQTTLVETNAPETSTSSTNDGYTFKWPLTCKRPRKLGDWFNYSQFRYPSGKSPTLFYCTSLKRSEEVAQMFMNEPILGFDMEWQGDPKRRHTIKDEISVIQLACESKIAVFHVAAHQGSTVADIVAPTLRTILESAKIVKVGVAVMNADFSRLRKSFDLKPRAGFELSRLYRLVKFGGKHLCTTDEEKRKKGLKELSTKLVAFDTQVQEIMGLKLYKGNVRTSHWNNPRPLSFEQQKYAANDAYAGFVLYHCMDAKRTEMDPVPGLPLLCDDADALGGLSRIKGLRLMPGKAGGTALSAEEFWPAPEPPKAEIYGESSVEQHQVINLTEDGSQPQTGAPNTQERARQPKEKTRDARPDLTPLERQLYGELASCRFKQQSAHGFHKAFMVAPNTVLQDLAFFQPTKLEHLSQLKGIGPKKIEQFGSQWIEIIIKFRSAKGITAVAELPYKILHRKMSPSKTEVLPNASAPKSSPLPSLDSILQQRSRVRERSPLSALDRSESSSPACDNPVQIKAQRTAEALSTVEDVVRNLVDNRSASYNPPQRVPQPAISQTPVTSQPPQLHTGLSFALEETAIEDLESYSELFSDTIDTPQESPSNSALERRTRKRRKTEVERLAD